MAKFAELRLFGRALENTWQEMAVDSAFVKNCASKGYVMHPDCRIDRVMSYIASLPNNYNSTFYKSFNDIINRSEEALWVDQCMHYASTYGTGHTGTPYVPNDNPAHIDFTECKIIEPITKKELIGKIEDMLNSGIALKNDTIDDIFELIGELQLNINLSNCKNREFVIRYHVKRVLSFDTVEETLQAINYVITGSACIVKDHATIQAYRDFVYKASGGNVVKNFEYLEEAFLEQHSLKEWASIFNRYKPLFLALRTGTPSYDGTDMLYTFLRRKVNKISKLSKKHHVPTVMPMSTKFLTPEYLNDNQLCGESINYIRRNRKDISLFQLAKYYTAVKKRMKGKFIDTINIRNGKSWVKKSSWDLDQDVLKGLESAIKRAFQLNMLDKLQGKTLNVPYGLGITIPTSEKNFIGSLPIGSYLNIEPEDNLIVGIYWKGEDGAQDLDLSFTDIDGNTVSWCNAYTDEGNNIVYSGDMTSANPEAAEYLLFRNNMPNGIFMCNSFCAEPESKYTFIVARLPEGTEFRDNHVVNPDDIIFQTPMVMTGRQMSMAIYVDGRFIFTNRATGNGRVARAGVTTRDLIQSQIDMADMSLTLNGFVQLEHFSDRDEDVVDLTTDDKSALISLLS